MCHLCQLFSPEDRRKRFGKRWRRKNLVRKFLKRDEGDAAESRMDEYEYEYIEDDEEAGLEEQRR